MEAVRDLLPPLSDSLHKGQCGRIGIVGGCEEYTGAPYFCASMAFKLGVDLVYVFCDKSASTAIKSYSPDLIVLPVIDVSKGEEDEESLVSSMAKINQWMEKFHCLVLGPGCGRSWMMQSVLVEVFKRAKELTIPMVIDADALYMIGKNLSLLQESENVVLAPNVMEFKRLCQAAFGAEPMESVSSVKAIELARKLGEHVTVVEKAKSDVIAHYPNIEITRTSDEGSPRRVGGQGDLLSGAIAAFMAWGKLTLDGTYKDRPLDFSNWRRFQHGVDLGNSKDDQLIPVVASQAACYVVRTFMQKAYLELGRSLLTSDVVNMIPLLWNHLLDQLGDYTAGEITRNYVYTE
ncbi:hypothetical protein MIR68_008161 [Amoeboaphelidium protococcarum]|nr:hypothetical protein MIR68_008161 [Amoeboaphelidium protococcarum]